MASSWSSQVKTSWRWTVAAIVFQAPTPIVLVELEREADRAREPVEVEGIARQSLGKLFRPTRS